MRADNRGEGGVLSLTALVCARRTRPGESGSCRPGGRRSPVLRRLRADAGDLGAQRGRGSEGRDAAVRALVLPFALVLLVGLFVVQRRGTGRVGGLFGPIMVVWFTMLACWVSPRSSDAPRILLALNPLSAIELIVSDPGAGFMLLGAVVLAVTGAEALYADMGHFGRPAIAPRLAGLVFPALLLNYFGQGALLLGNPAALENPFYLLAPGLGAVPAGRARVGWRRSSPRRP